MPYGPYGPVVSDDVGAQRGKPLTAKERRNVTVQQRKEDAKHGKKALCTDSLGPLLTGVLSMKTLLSSKGGYQHPISGHFGP